MLHDGLQALVVDPGDAAPVHQGLTDCGLMLSQILVTHHHADHVGGLAALQQAWPSVLTVQPGDEPMPGHGQAVQGGDRFVWNGAEISVLAVPGHTRGHLAYFVEFPHSSQAPVLFCGDTLFSAGCGRLFEGTPGQMAESLDRLVRLSGDTRVCCAHEYTLTNLRFASAVEPRNAKVAEHLQVCQALRDAGHPTLPSSLALEIQINPFLRCTHPDVVRAALAQGAVSSHPVAVFTALREWKNQFR